MTMEAPELDEEISLLLLEYDTPEDEFEDLCKCAPLETIQNAPQVRPETHKREVYRGADLKKTINKRDWEETSRFLKGHPKLAKQVLSEDEFNILWSDAPLETIRVLLNAWPEAYKKKRYFNSVHSDLVAVKLSEKQWDFLKSIIHTHPNVVTTDHVYDACFYDVPIDIFLLMLEHQPNALLEEPNIIFESIEYNKLEHFCAVLDRCPAATEVTDYSTHLTPLLILVEEKEKINSDWIGPILRANPDAAKQRDFDGKTALHLAYQHGASAELINMMQQACPDAESIRDNLGRLPKDLVNPSEKTVFTAANDTLILGDNLNDKKNNSYPENAVVVCRGDMLIRDPQTGENEEGKDAYGNYSEQIHARDEIFGTLLYEFSMMVGIKDKDVIQKAAALQALLAQYLSNKNGTVINFRTFESPGYWLQQEILKLVMRVYCETLWKLKDPKPSVLKDAEVCMEHLNGFTSLKPSKKHAKAYNELTQWLTEGFGDSSLYSLQGPVLKPLQSLFNKLFIRRGQTSVHVIGDMVRGTLLLDNMAMLDEVVKRMKNTFPNITENQFRHPDSFNGLADFLTYVHDDLNFLPGSDNVLPYRLKANSSQKKKDKPLWYNLNFFLQIPEYHRVGFSEMFVACELQIGLAEEINKHRSVHDAYERDRILSNQPLLKNYDAMMKEEEGEDKSLQLSNCTENDNKLIEKVLFGKISSEVLIPCTTPGDENKSNALLFENGPFSLSVGEAGNGTFVRPERQCINNRSLNWFASGKVGFGNVPAAFVVAGPYELDETKRYFVESFVLRNIHSENFCGTVGLYAHVGPYLIQIACSYVENEDEEDIVVVMSGQNLSYLERVCPVPPGTTALEVIAYGRFEIYGEIKYDEMNLSLKVFDIQ